MSTNPANLVLRFLLELAALAALGRWGFRAGEGAMRFVLAVALPLLAATAWGVFAVPGDPSRSGNAPVPTPGTIRLLIELVYFGLAAAALHDVGYDRLARVFGIVVALHYALSWDRVAWLVRGA